VRMSEDSGARRTGCSLRASWIRMRLFGRPGDATNGLRP
jgi:hypothetical protein